MTEDENPCPLCEPELLISNGAPAPVEDAPSPKKRKPPRKRPKR